MKRFLLISSLIIFSMSNSQNTYLALGDSYTICEGLAFENTWAYHLSNYFSFKGHETKQPVIIAKTGWRTDELIDAVKEQDKGKTYDIISILIGVNNEYQGKAFSQYENELRQLIDIAVSKSNSGAAGVFMVSIPDYSVTPFAIKKDKTKAYKTLKKYNKYAKKLCKEYGIPFYNITKLSKKLSKKEEYLHTDKLHPNEKQYQAWIDTFKDDVIEYLFEK